MAYKILGQARPTSGTPTPTLVAPQGSQVVISSIVVCNTSTATDYFSIRVIQAGASADDKQWNAFKVSIAPGGVRTLTLGITLEATDSITVKAENNTCSFSAYGSTGA